MGSGPPAGEPESLVTVDFRDLGERTEVVLTHSEFPLEHGPAPYQMGWEGGFDKIERLLARSPRMPEASNRLVVRRARSEVFEFLANAENDRQ